MLTKQELDNILVLHKAQPVGTGYIDIIVKREFARKLIENLIQNGFTIQRITWWEYVNSVGKAGSYGYGGPKSHYYDGWFSEIGTGDDEISTSVVEEIMEVIEKKEITFYNGATIRYTQDVCLTPGLWLDVPDEWER